MVWAPYLVYLKRRIHAIPLELLVFRAWFVLSPGHRAYPGHSTAGWVHETVGWSHRIVGCVCGVLCKQAGYWTWLERFCCYYLRIWDVMFWFVQFFLAKLNSSMICDRDNNRQKLKTPCIQQNTNFLFVICYGCRWGNCLQISYCILE